MVQWFGLKMSDKKGFTKRMNLKSLKKLKKYIFEILIQITLQKAVLKKDNAVSLHQFCSLLIQFGPLITWLNLVWFKPLCNSNLKSSIVLFLMPAGRVPRAMLHVKGRP